MKVLGTVRILSLHGSDEDLQWVGLEFSDPNALQVPDDVVFRNSSGDGTWRIVTFARISRVHASEFDKKKIAALRPIYSTDVKLAPGMILEAVIED